MDIVRKIKENLHEQVCPIYTNYDIDRDIAKLCIALSIEPLPISTSPSFYTKKHIWSRFKISLEMEKKEQMDAVKVRSIIRKQFDNDNAAWLGHYIVKNFGMKIEPWFLEAMFPLNESMREIENFPGEYKKVRKYAVTNDLITYVKECRKKRETMQYEDVFDRFATNEERKMGTVGLMMTNHLYNSFKEVAVEIFVPGTFKRALEIQMQMQYVAFNVAYVVVDYVLWGTVDSLPVCASEVDARVSTEYPQFIREFATSRNMDSPFIEWLAASYQTRCLKMIEIMRIVESVCDDFENIREFDDKEMDAVITWSVVLDVTDRVTHLTLQDLCSLSIPFTVASRHTSADQFRNMFDRFDKMRKVWLRLVGEGYDNLLEHRMYTSNTCACYVLDGIFGDNVVEDDFDLSELFP